MAKTASLYLMTLAIVVLFYSYTTILGEDILIMDILIFMLVVVIGQLASYKLLIPKKLPQIWNKLAFILLIFAVIVFSLLTYYAPELFLFQDPVTGGYGIPN